MEQKLFRTIQIRREIEEEPGVNGIIIEIDLAAARNGVQAVRAFSRRVVCETLQQPVTPQNEDSIAFFQNQQEDVDMVLNKNDIIQPEQ